MKLNRALWLLLPAATLGIDWASKAMILARFREGEVKAVIPGFFNLTLGYNPGAIFGSFANLSPGLRIAIFGLAGVAAIGYFGWEFLREGTSTLQRVALGLILGGALGNGLDRFRHGAVVDFLDFVFFGWHYWTFNLADSAILCGVVLMAWGMIQAARQEKAKA